ncbi:crotonase/enoyl-CoA hydratase family protein [Jannaschia seohaensis]|uniref:Methylglutaconyl-CoA hydratase n=1 Tax=Jannaschia seohaensis TaxID=475081 RepID=A0A2Y9B383_9RHOB|nr:crotonase/enoyl-CoA hydratase family protein [Jannaschia seohaensis]PWJ12465.1 methylglutaconyl-CoA hydratase [Jannaschia seohaensis]SSA50946.1 methylglutaconyl-CoA hydratase [Jannaschia seohaensis]
MSDETLEIARDGRGVVTVTLNRPDVHNALNARMMDELTDFAGSVVVGETRAVVLTGAGRSFCAGGDLGWMRAQFDAAPEARAAEGRRLAEMLQALNTMPVPLIGRVQGAAFGGGVGMACVCDVAVAADTAKFGLTETRLGLIPATIGPYVIARMGEGRARRVFMSSRRFDAAEAEALGVIAGAVPPEALDAAVEAEVAPYLACAPGAVAEAKALARSLGPVIDRDTIAASIDALTRRWAGDEAAEGVGAFFEKRAPRWAE